MTVAASEHDGAQTLAQGLERFRALRRELEEAVLPLATSLDGRRFTFQASLRLVGLAPAFRSGEALVAGKLSPQPALLRFGARISEEGGSDVPATWAERT